MKNGYFKTALRYMEMNSDIYENMLRGLIFDTDFPEKNNIPRLNYMEWVYDFINEKDCKKSSHFDEMDGYYYFTVEKGYLSSTSDFVGFYKRRISNEKVLEGIIENIEDLLFFDTYFLKLVNDCIAYNESIKEGAKNEN